MSLQDLRTICAMTKGSSRIGRGTAMAAMSAAKVWSLFPDSASAMVSNSSNLTAVRILDKGFTSISYPLE
ncbi:MAG: hypothetical protein BWX80_02168 [Candidatus Hydrogenedentes bacterium ADurb.Bin101]|nr:MAG: hypothetical protein BWX80_02168 [Candidatus Hydrogenedentes bacterium ADurb.Bin101]